MQHPKVKKIKNKKKPGKKVITKLFTCVVGLNSELPPCHLSNKNETPLLPLRGLFPHFGSKPTCIMSTSHAILDVCPERKLFKTNIQINETASVV
jgi:hypothetical protein